MSAGRYALILFLANAAAFLLLGWGLESWDGEAVDWAKIAGVAVLMGLVSVDLARRLGGVKAGESRPGFAAYAKGTYWLLGMWAALLAALGLSFLAVRLLA